MKNCHAFRNPSRRAREVEDELNRIFEWAMDAGADPREMLAHLSEDSQESLRVVAGEFSFDLDAPWLTASRRAS